MEYIDGFSIGDIKKLEAEKINKKEVCKLLSTMFCFQIFSLGHFHCDPHQGNLFLRKVKNSRGKEITQLVLLDHGLYKRIDKNTIINYSKLWHGMPLTPFTQKLYR